MWYIIIYSTYIIIITAHTKAGAMIAKCMLGAMP